MLRVDKVIKPWKESAALNDHINLYGFWNETTVSTGFSVNEKPVTAQVDTLFSGTMLIYPTSVEKLGLAEAARTTRKQFFKYTDDGVEMLEAQSKVEGFGERSLVSDAPLYFATPAVHLPDGMFDATVGQALFRHSVLLLDFHDMKLWMSE